MAMRRFASRLLAALVVTTMQAASAQVVYETSLAGASEIPPNASTATGTATVTYFPGTSTMTVATSFSGLSGTTTAAHIHCCTPLAGTSNAGVATQTPTFPGFPTNVSAGTYANTFDLNLASSYNASFLTSFGGNVIAAREALLAGMGSGRAYFNIHTGAFPGGEIRGNLVEPGIFRNGFD